MATSATLQKARSTDDRKVFELQATDDADTEIRLVNDFGTVNVQALIEPAAGRMTAAYLASDWRISHATTAEEIVLVKEPARGSGVKAPQAVVFVSAIAVHQVPAVPTAAAPRTKKPAAKAKK